MKGKNIATGSQVKVFRGGEAWVMKGKNIGAKVEKHSHGRGISEGREQKQAKMLP